MKSFRNFVVVVVLLSIALFFTVGGSPIRSDMPRIDPDLYPEIGDEEMGQLRWVLGIADQPLDDFTNIEATNQYGMTAYRYSIAFMTYFLAVEQYRKLPAYPELIQPRMDRFVRKIIQKPVWEFWAEISRGLPLVEPKFNRPYPEDHDPVGKKNIMYSGHLGHMIALYEMLYRDMKWSGPETIVFAWSDDEKYVYNNHSLQRVMYDQMMNHPANCIECEPNLCFPECNQHPILSFMLYDHVHGTNLAQAREPFLNFFLKNKMIDPRNHHAAALYLVKQKKTLGQKSPGMGNVLSVVVVPAVSLGVVSITSSSANGWTGTFMHAWQPEYIERHYPYQLESHLVEIDSESARLEKDYFEFEPRLRYGFFAMLAAEVGDTDTRDKLLAYADRKYNPVRENGTLHYPFDKKKKCTNLTGKLLALARALSKNVLWDIHNKPFDKNHFAQPTVAEVDFPRMLLRRAIYDEQKRALIVTTEPGHASGVDDRGKTSLKILQLDPDKSYRLLIDGEGVKKFQGQSSYLVEVALDGRHDIVLLELQ